MKPTNLCQNAISDRSRWTATMKLPWHIEDIIDLEYFLQKDEEGDEAVISRRDRETFLKRISPSLTTGELSEDKDRRNAIRLWVDERRRLENPHSQKEDGSPGKLLSGILSLVSVILLIAGLFTGAGLAFTILTYHGSKPINVSTYLGIFVLLQILLVTILVFWRLFRHFIVSLQRLSILQFVLGPVLAGLFRRLATRSLGSLSAENRNHIAAVAGIIKGHNRIYGSIFYWRAFILSQIFGIGFNIGVPAASWMKILGSDLAFGWQSTLQVSSQAVHQFVKILATPWSFFFSPPFSHPTLEQIHGSRMVLKDGIYSLTTPDLVSWWPFLMLAVCCYGLLPRVILYVGGIIAQKRALATLRLDHANCGRLLRRMALPHLETEGQKPFYRDRPQIDSQADNYLPTDSLRSAEPEQIVYVLIPDDISCNLSAEALKPLLGKIQGSMPLQQVKVSLDFEADREILVKQLPPNTDEPELAIAFLQEAWQPPIAETLSYFRSLRELLATRTRLHIFLLGKMSSKTGLLPVTKADMRTWRQALEALGDPYLEIDRSEDVP